MKHNCLILVLCLCLGSTAKAQTFAPAFQGFSKKKPTYITLKNGQEMEVNIKRLYFKRGLIDDLKVVDGDGEKVKINPEEIDHMYVAPSGLAKLSQALDAATDLTKLQDNELSTEHLDDGYLYMESSNVQVKKKKTQFCMLQVMNPTFSKKVTVYNDPFANESIGVGVAGMTVAGGLDKSYYIKKEGEDLARKITKKEYKREKEELFAECPAVLKKYDDNAKWADFEQFIYDYSVMCD